MENCICCLDNCLNEVCWTKREYLALTRATLLFVLQMMPHKWLYDFVETVCLRKTLFWSYWPKSSPPIWLQDFLNVNISKTIWGIIFFFLHVVRKSWNLYLNNEIFVGFGQVCPGMPSTLQNNKAPISLGRVELFCLFVAYSYTSLEVTVLSAFICMLLDIHWSYKNMLFLGGILKHRFSANRIFKCFKLKKLENYKWYQVDFLLPLKPQKISVSRIFDFDLFDLLILILGVHCYIVLVYILFHPDKENHCF